MECIRCGHRNPDKAFFCNICGEVLSPKGGITLQHEPLIGTSYLAMPTVDVMKRQGNRARFFILLRILFWQVLATLGPAASIEPWAWTMKEIREYIMMDTLFNHSVSKNATILYLLTSGFVWIKTVYEELKMPVI